MRLYQTLTAWAINNPLLSVFEDFMESNSLLRVCLRPNVSDNYGFYGYFYPDQENCIHLDSGMVKAAINTCSNRLQATFLLFSNSLIGLLIIQ
jgi:hypothetical protein